MKKYIFIIFMVLFSSCVGKRIIVTETNVEGYLIEKIKKKGDWYMIYASKEDTLYKIISKKIKNRVYECEKIKKGNKYKFQLKSEKDFAPTIDGIKISPINFNGCYYYSDNTLICLEPENGIWELFTAQNVKGLYFCN